MYRTRPLSSICARTKTRARSSDAYSPVSAATGASTSTINAGRNGLTWGVIGARNTGSGVL